MYSFHHHRRCWPTSIQYLPVNRAVAWCVSTMYLVHTMWALPTQCWFNVGPASQPIAGSMPVNSLRRWPNTIPTLGLLYTLHQYISKHMAFTQCCFDVHPQSSTLARVCLVYYGIAMRVTLFYPVARKVTSQITKYFPKC